MPGRGSGPGVIVATALDLNSINLEDIALALSDQDHDEHMRLINPETGAIEYWTPDTGIDGQNPVDLDELDLIGIHPLPSWSGTRTWLTSPAESPTSRRGAGSHARSGEYPDLLDKWHAFCDTRAQRRAVEWLAEQSLADSDAADQYLASHPDPELP